MSKRGHVRVHRSAIHREGLWPVLVTACMLAGRFAVGLPMDGRRRTNATFLAAGTANTQGMPDWMGPTTPTRWSYLPGWKRAAIRWTCVATLVAYLAWPDTVTLTLAGIASGLAGHSCARAYVELRTRAHRRDVVRPAYLALSQYLGTSPTDRPERWLRVPADYATDPHAAISLALPDGFDANESARVAIEGVISRRIRGQWEPTWTATGVTWRRIPQPPDRVTYADIYPAAIDSPEHLVPIGFTARGQLATIDIDGDAPHVAYTGGTGAGKSTFLRWVGAFLIHKGAESGTIIDPKRISLRKPFKGVPNVSIYKDLDAQVAALAEARADMEARYAWAESQSDPEEALASLRRKFLIIEEGGTFFERVRNDWANRKQKGDPAEPPAITDYREIMYMGRQGRWTVILVVQHGNARDMGASHGNSAIRDQFAARVLVRFSPKVWAMLVGTASAPRAPKHRGRGYLVIGDEETLVQLVNPSSDEARAFALEGEPQAPDHVGLLTAVPASPERQHVGRGLGDVPATGQQERQPAALQLATRQYSLDEVVSALGTTHDAFKRWRQRAKKRGQELPEPTYIKNRPVWDEDQVDELRSLRDKSA